MSAQLQIENLANYLAEDVAEYMANEYMYIVWLIECGGWICVEYL